MACSTSFSPFKSRLLLASTVLLLFTPPIFSMLIFFWPLIVSTVLGVLAVVSFGPPAGILTGQEMDNTENRVADQDMVISSAAHTEKISDVLMVGNEEVTWLEWLHNEDMEKCRAQERSSCIPATWDFDEHDVVSEAFVDTLPSRVEEKSMVDAYGSIVAHESFANEQVENATKMIAVCSTATIDDDICGRTQVYSKMNVIGLASPVLDVSRAYDIDPFREEVDVVRKNAPLLKVEDTLRKSSLTEEVVNVMQKEKSGLVMNSLTMTAAKRCYESTAASRICCRNLLDSEVNDEKIENKTEEETHLDSESRFADGFEVQKSISRQVLAMQADSIVHAFALEVRDETTTSQHGAKVVVENKASECISVDGDGGECILPSVASKVISETNASEVLFPKEGTLERNGSVGHEMGHAKEENAEERDSNENNGSPIWDVSDEEENKSSLQFSFFQNGCLMLTPVKHEA